jgi:UDP-N-acetylmuramate--alanine ligase
VTDQRKFNLFFVGIGGIGMSGIAEIFLAQGHEVSGSDLNSSEITERLVKMGATIYQGHARANIGEAIDVVVISSAVGADNPEILQAKARGIPVVPRAEMLAEVMRGKTGISIAGTHGKTTTTAMTAQILMKAGLDPTVVVGGKVEAIGSNAKVGAGTAVVVEADESDGSFHLLPATYGVITNIDLDHMEFYHSREKLNEAFVQFTKNIPFYGATWLCGDDAGIQQILTSLTKPYFTYGFDEENDLWAKNFTVHPRGVQKYELWHRPKRNEAHVFLGEIELSVLGKHNVLNSLAAIGISLSLEVPFLAARDALREFKHVRRRFDERYHSPKENIRIIDDYGHHPTEVRAVLATADQTGHERIVTLFQPHRYTRTQLCWSEFLTCFDDTDVLILLPIYAANEEPIAGITSTRLAQELRARSTQHHKGTAVIEVQTMEEAGAWVLQNKKPGDLILTLGAGSITKLADQLAKRLFPE